MDDGVGAKGGGGFGGEVWGLQIIGSTLGVDTVTDAIKWRGDNSGAGLVNAYIDRNWMNGLNISLTAVTDSHIRIPNYTGVFSASTVDISVVSVGSRIEAPVVTFGAYASCMSSKIIENNPITEAYNEKYGPGAFHSAQDGKGSVISIRPTQVEPIAKEAGTIATTLGSTGWDPANNQQEKSYPVLYDGAKWLPLASITSGNNSIAQWVYTEANTNEKTLHSLTIPAGSLGPNAYTQILKIKASGYAAGNANVKTIKLKLTDSTNSVVFLQNTVTADPNGLAWIAEAEIGLNSVYANGHWSFVGSFGFSGLAPQIDSGVFNAAGNVIGFDEDVTLSVTGQNGTANANDIGAFTLSWSLIRAE